MSRQELTLPLALSHVPGLQARRGRQGCLEGREAGWG